MTGIIVDIVTGCEVQPNQRGYGGFAVIPEPTLTELVRGACFGARRHVQSAGWTDGKPWLVVLIDHQRWAYEVQARETVIGDRMVLRGHRRPERLIVIVRAPQAAAA